MYERISAYKRLSLCTIVGELYMFEALVVASITVASLLQTWIAFSLHFGLLSLSFYKQYLSKKIPAVFKATDEGKALSSEKAATRIAGKRLYRRKHIMYILYIDIYYIL